MKLLTMLILLLGFSAHAQSGEDRGGGGGICLNGKCITVAEAGFRTTVSSTEAAPAISAATFEELQNIMNKIPMAPVNSKEYLESVVAAPETYIRVTSYDPKKFEKYKQEYLKLFNETEMSAKGLTLLAVTIDGKNGLRTYLLPEFYSANARSQALTLIHERNIRVGFSVREALYVDGKILDYLAGKTSDVDVLLAMYKHWPSYFGSVYVAKEWLSLELEKIQSTGQFVDVTPIANYGDIDFTNSMVRVYLQAKYPSLLKTDSVVLISMNSTNRIPRGNGLSDLKDNDLAIFVRLDAICKSFAEPKTFLYYDKNLNTAWGRFLSTIGFECENHKATVLFRYN